MMYDRMTAGPAFAKANPGSMNSPELIIAPVATQKTSRAVSSLFRLLSTVKYSEFLPKRKFSSKEDL
jgi:hypothetical protein